jgi:hypothetical protein
MYHSGMLYLVNHILHDTSGDDGQFYFLLCVRGYQRLARCLPVCAGILMGILAMALGMDAISFDSFRALGEDVTMNMEEVVFAAEYSSAYLIDLELASIDEEAASLELLVREFRSAMAVTRQDIDGYSIIKYS